MNLNSLAMFDRNENMSCKERADEETAFVEVLACLRNLSVDFELLFRVQVVFDCSLQQRQRRVCVDDERRRRACLCFL